MALTPAVEASRLGLETALAGLLDQRRQRVTPGLDTALAGLLDQRRPRREN